MAEIVATVGVATAEVAMVNVVLVDPPGTAIVEGTAANPESEASAIAMPPDGAAPVRETVPVELAPPVTVVGLSEIEVSVGALTFNLALSMMAPNDVEIVATLFVATAEVAIEKVVLVVPAATTTLDGTAANPESETIEIVVPDDGATLPSVTVPVELTPPITALGLSVMRVSLGEVTVNFAVLVTAPVVPAIVATLVVAIADVVIAKVAVVAPPKTATLAGTEANVESDESETEVPPAGAAPVRVTVPDELEPPAIDVGLKVIE